MEHQVSISVSKRPQARTVNLKRVTIRERLLRWLLGAPTHLLVIAPNDSGKATTNSTFKGGKQP